MRFENKNIIFYIEKTLHPTTMMALYVVVNAKVIGLGLGANPTTSFLIYNHDASIVLCWSIFQSK
jgi:hypothetical protein